MGSHSTPFYLPVGEMLLDVIKRGHYQYFYSDVKSNSYGEIVINFKQGTANVIGRIVKKDIIDDNANWNKRVKLPLISDTNDTLSGILKFDYYNKKIVFTEEDTKDCENGCEIYIGIMSNETGGDLRSNLIDYSIFMRYDDTIVEIEQDEYVFGSLSKTIDENEMDYFKIKVLTETNRVIVEFDSELCEIYVKKEENFDFQSYDYLITSNDTFHEIDAELNDTLIFAVSTKKLNGDFTSFYSFKVFLSHTNEYPLIQRIESTQNEFCIIDNSKDEKNRCLFLVPIYEYNTVRKTYFYAENEDNPNNNEITFFAKNMTLDAYEKSDNKISLFPNESDNNANVDNSNILNYTLSSERNKSYYILITLKSSNNGKIIFLPFYNLQLQSTYLRPNSKQLFNIFSKGTSTYTGHQRLDIYVPENETYNFEIVSLYGSGIIQFANDNFILFKNENLYSSNSTYSSYSSYSSYTGIINPSSIDFNLITIDVYNDIKGLIFYIKYVWRSSKENFDEFESDKTTNIKYFNKNIPQFPISLYTKVNKDDKDIIINFTLFNNSDADKGTFKVNSYIVDKDYILNRKKDLNYESTNTTNGDTFINNEKLTGEVYFSEDAISSLDTKETKYFLLII